MLTQERLKELLQYDPLTGVFTWLISRGGMYKGSSAGRVGTSGHIEISLFSNRHQAHRLAFLYMIGRFPLEETDHINRKPSDNRWVNLREVTHKQNKENLNLQKNNTSGHIGVSWSVERGKWQAYIKHQGERIPLGRFTNLEDAIAARKEAERSLFTHAQL